jgi:glycine hydroxymethyltransferase
MIHSHGFDEKDCRELAGWMCDIIDANGDDKVISEVKAKALDICKKNPVYK